MESEGSCISVLVEPWQHPRMAPTSSRAPFATELVVDGVG